MNALEMTNEPDSVATVAVTRCSLLEELLHRNRPVLLTAIACAGLQAIAVRYSGSGDEGNIDTMLCRQSDSETWQAVPEAAAEIEVTIYRYHGSWSDQVPPAELQTETLTLEAALTDHAEEILQHYYRGWENGEGAEGSIIFDTGATEIRIEHGIFVVTKETEVTVLP